MKHITLALTELQEADLRLALLDRIKELHQLANNGAEANLPDVFTGYNDRALELRDVYDQLNRPIV